MKVQYLFFTILFSTILFAQNHRSITWSNEIDIVQVDSLTQVLNFTNAIYRPEMSDNLVFFEKIPIEDDQIDLDLLNVKYLNVEESESLKISHSKLDQSINYDYFIGTEKKQSFLFFYLEPFRKVNDSIQKVSEFTINILPQKKKSSSKNNSYVSNSILSSGDWYKISVNESGLHKLDYNFLNEMGVDPGSINPKNIRIYGNKSGVLKEGDFEIDDLSELSILVFGENDGVFDEDDLILFYGQSPDTWSYDGNKFIHQKNIYSDETCYFVCFDIGEGKRIPIIENNNVLENLIMHYDAYLFHEEDLYNLVNTGRQWFGESFSFNYLQSFNTPVNNWNMDTLLFSARLVARSSNSTSFNISFGNSSIGNFPISPIQNNGSNYSSVFVQEYFYPNIFNSTISFNYNNNGNNSAEAWLDYYTLQGRANLASNSGSSQFLFRDVRSIGSNFSSFGIQSNMPSISVWDVTDPINVNSILLNKTNQVFYFTTPHESLREFLVFQDPVQDAFSPQFVEFVPSQNIHAFSNPTYIIVTHPDFLNAANRLANHHINNNNDNVLVATTKEVYNEFSTGSQDISAIRNMLKMFYDRAEDPSQMPKNLLLFGDASFDYKNKLYGVSNYVPTYQSYNSNNIESSFCTDDFFGVLDDGEGHWNGGSNYTDLLDIGIGRIPVTNIADAEAYVDKVISYTSSISRGYWKNKMCFVADDVDDGWEISLVNQADDLASKISNMYSQFNLSKIYIDSYQQSLSSGSQRYPEAQNDLRNIIEEGVLLVNYVGHGGEVGWASERILELSDINGFTNFNKLPVFITATCEFTRYDDATRVSAGEYLLLNPNGGAIGLYSTSRTVTASETYNLVNSLYDFLPDKNSNYTFGESICLAKNNLGNTNYVVRKFSFFGDPNLKLSHPKFNIQTTSIELLDSLNQVIPVSNNEFENDTISSLSHVRVFGQVLDNTSLLNSFNGQLNVSVYGKSDSLITLNNDEVVNNAGIPIEPFKYELQSNIIYNGLATVEDGNFSFEFIVPKDINYQYGTGKLSYYASDPVLGEANGFDKNFYVGGVSDYASIDFEGPQIQLFMNDTNFVSGGYTNSEPQLLALLFDQSGINTVGTGIGHDLTAILDENIVGQFILNDYYESDLDSFQSGRVRYQLNELSEGEHTLRFKAWDVHNNSSIAELSFFVTSNPGLAISHLFNYPNPSSEFTRFVFEHNRAYEDLDVKIDIFSINGKLVKTLSSTIFATGFREESISWNIDSSIDKGIYIYRLTVQSQNDESISQKTEKLIIVR